MPRRFATALPSWLIAVAGTIVALTQDGTQWSGTISVALGASILVSFFIQLSLQRKEGLVNRLAFTTAGSLLVAAVGVAGSLLLHGVG